MGTILFLSMLLASCSKNNDLDPQTKVLTKELKAQLEDAADQIFLQYNVPGMIVLIAAEGEEDYIIKRGVGNIETGEPMDENNYFRIASITKTFTGTAVLLLADEGKINLDSTISHYLFEYNVPSGTKITIRMLGNMRSGLYNYTNDPGFLALLKEYNYIRNLPPDSLIATSFRHPLSFEPGTDFEYSNTNTVLLGLLIEKVTGKPAGQVIREKVLNPLNLKHTHWPNSIFLLSPYCHGYSADDNYNIIDASIISPTMGYTAGAMISTINDLKIWAKALAEGQLLSARMKTERFSWGRNDYGFNVTRENNWIGHDGSIRGYNSSIRYNSEKKITLAISLNTDIGNRIDYYLILFEDILDR